MSCHGTRCRRTLAAAIRNDSDVPLPLRAADAGPFDHRRDHGDGLRDDGPPNLAADDQVLGHAVRHQFRAGRGDGHHDGVPVRYELELLQPLCGRCFRRAARRRGPHGLLPRGHLCRPVFLRLGQAFQGRTPHRHLARGPRLEPISSVDPDRQWLDAESRRRRLQSRHDADGDDLLLRGAVQHGSAEQIRPYRFRRLCHGVGLRAGRLGLVSPQRPAS